MFHNSENLYNSIKSLYITAIVIHTIKAVKLWLEYCQIKYNKKNVLSNRQNFST